ncbi:MAG TPA: hypothetical protein VLX68_05125 [Chitinivibrionales bacterium]|nr:hypothetical protein [Chitinivibrionales bacterium]
MIHHDLIPACIVSGAFLLVFAAAELWRILGRPSKEATRKLVHFSCGTICLGFSYLLRSHWTVLTLCFLFVAIMVFTKRFGLLPSIHGVERKSQGSLYYPVAVYVSFVLSSAFHRPDLYLIGILVLAVSDSLAALVGGRYGFKVYIVEEHHKSLEGSVFFFLATFIIIHLCLLLLSPVDRAVSVLMAVYCSLLVTAFESISLGGADNLFIPLGTIVLLQRVADKGIFPLAARITAVASLFALVYLLSRRFKRFGITAIIGLALTGYAALMYGGPAWLVPVVVGIALFTTLDIFIEEGPTVDTVYRIRPVFYLLFVSFAWTVVAGINAPFRNAAFVSFVTNITANFGILWQRRARMTGHPYRLPLPLWLRNAHCCVRALALTLVFAVPTVLLDPRLSAPFTIGATAAGTIAIELVYWFVERRKRGTWSDMTFLRFTALVSALVTVLLFAASVWFYNIDTGAALK